MKNFIFIPGGEHQLNFLLENHTVKNEKTLIIGSAHEGIAESLSMFTNDIEVIVEDYTSLVNTNYSLRSSTNLVAKLMSFEITDYEPNSFDLIFAQASISLENRKNILKEVKRLLKPNGILCVGEITKLTSQIPKFVEDIYYSSGIEPIYSKDLIPYYQSKNFEIIKSHDLSHHLKKYYSNGLNSLKKLKPNLSKQEISYYKKLLNRMSHESNVFLSHGGDKHMGMTALICRLKK